MGLAHSPSVVTDGLVLSLDAGNSKNYNVGVSTNWVDKVGGNNGTLYGGTHHNDGPFVGAGYVEFDGTGDNLSISSASSLGGFSGDFTIEFWFKGDNQNGFAVFLESWVSFTSSTQKWAIQAEGSGTTNMIWVRDGLVKFTTSGIDVFDNAWHHHAVVRDGSTITYYIDGVSRGSETHSAALTPGTDFIIGEFSSGGYGIGGYLSNVRIVEGTAIYTTTFTPPTKSLTAVPDTKLLTCQGNTITDASSSGHTFTTNGDAAANLGFPASAFEFDGTNDYVQLPASSDLNFGTGNFTIEGWFNKDATTALQTLLCSNKYYINGNNGNWILRISSATQIALATYDGTGNIEYAEFSASTSVNTWYHFALVREGTGTNETKFYLDGVLKGSMTVSKSLTDAGTNGLRIGEESDSGPGNAPFNGKISNVKLYKGKGLTATEVLQNYNATKGRYA